MTSLRTLRVHGARVDWPLLGIGLFAALVLTYNAWLYYPFMADDAFISLRYSERLLNGQGLTWTDGERVEGYSNLLWVLGCASLGALKLDLVVAARLLGWLCSIAMLGAFVYAAKRISRVPLFVAGTALLTLAVSGPIAVWTIGGLEQSMAAALLAWSYVLALQWIGNGMVFTRRKSVLLGALLGMLCWTRPDGALFAAVLYAWLVLGAGFRRDVLRLCGLAACVTFAFAFAQLAFRLAYYHQWVANTALVKLSFTPVRRQEGWKYLSDGLEGMQPALVLVAPLPLLALRDLRAYRSAILLGVSAFVWCCYVVVIGGDIFPAHRHLVVLVPFIALLIVESGRAVQMFGRRAFAAWKLAAVCCLLAFSWKQWRDYDNNIAHLEVWEWDGVPVGRFLSKHFAGKKPLLAADAVGALVYFAKLPALDMMGLNDRYLAEHPPEIFGWARLAHELGDGRYVLRRKPDLVMFNFPTGDYGGVWRSGRQMVTLPEFSQHYRHVVFETEAVPCLETHVYVRLDGTAGIIRGATTVIPGYFWGHSVDTVTHADASGRLGSVLRGHASSRLTRIALPNARRLVVHSSGEPVIATLKCGDRTGSTRDPALTTWDCADPAQFMIELENTGSGLAHVRDIEFVP